MKTLRFAFVLVALMALAALPASAQSIAAGPDRWVTPGNGQTFLIIPDGELEALCGQPASSGWNHRVPFIGAPIAATNDWDTEVRRLDKATFVNRVASTRIQVSVLNFKGLETRSTPCGLNSFSAHLRGVQPITKMTLQLTHATGGVFFADIRVSTEIRVYSATGALLGSIPFAATLPSPATGTPFTLTAGGVFKPGIDSSSGVETCIDVLRQKLAGYPVDSSHYYFIENLIAQGKCYERP